MESSAMDEPPPPKDFAVPPPSSVTSSGYFDCNICLDSAQDPVVTLCGHLYCCPCINKWLLVEDDVISPQSCPVCKAPLSPDSLVHLHGRGRPAGRKRYGGHRHPPEHGRSCEGELLPPDFSHPVLMGSTSGGVLGEMAFATALTGGVYYSSRYYRDEGSGGSRSLRRQEMEARVWLKQMWVFMLCFALLCLVRF